MARDTATKLIIGLSLYFVVLFVVIFLVGSFVTYFGLEDNSLISSSGGSSGVGTITSECSAPRFEGDDVRFFARIRTPALFDARCSTLQKNGVVYNNDTCEVFRDCNWVTETSWFGFGSTTETCTGLINMSYYNNNTLYATPNALGYIDKPICEMSDLQTDEGLCLHIGCTYKDDSLTGNPLNPQSTFKVWETIKDIFTFRMGFGTTSVVINVFLSFLIVWLPLITMMLSVYVLIR